MPDTSELLVVGSVALDTRDGPFGTRRIREVLGGALYGCPENGPWIGPERSATGQVEIADQSRGRRAFPGQYGKGRWIGPQVQVVLGYARLVETKQAWDPLDVFNHAQSIGSG